MANAKLNFINGLISFIEDCCIAGLLVSIIVFFHNIYLQVICYFIVIITARYVKAYIRRIIRCIFRLSN